MNSRLFKILPTIYSFTDHVYMLCVCKQELALNNQQGLICRKTNQPTNQSSGPSLTAGT